MGERSHRYVRIHLEKTGLAADLTVLSGMGAAYGVLHLLFINQYGYFRDELYYIACSDRLAWGYVDHPPLSIAALALIRLLFGDSLPALRFAPALAGAAGILLTGLMARAMGAGRPGQILAASCVMVAPVYLFTTHVYSMNAFDLLFWTVSAFLVVLILKTRDPRLWLGLGAAVGLGLLNKISLIWLCGGLAFGFLLTPDRRLLRSVWPWVAAALAALLFLPHLLWQVAMGWPTLEFMKNATAEKMADVSYLNFLKMQLNALHPFTVPVWVGGLLYCTLVREGRRWRILGFAFLAVFLFLMASGKARASYLAPAFPMMFAAGGLAIERSLDRRRLRWIVPAYVTLLALGGAVAAPLVLPVLPAETLVRYTTALGVKPHQEERTRLGPLPQHFADMFGWEDLTATVARIYETVAEADRARCVIFTENYGEAGAIEFFGKRYGLPPVVSRHNNYWLWGPRGFSGEIVIAVGGDREDEEANFSQVTQAASFDCPMCMPYENGRPIWLGRGLRVDLRELWPRMKTYE